MRLRQLARKIDKNPAQIISFLADKGVTIDNDDNAKVEDAHADVVLKHFAPELINDSTAETPDEPPVPQPGEDSSKPVEEDLPTSESVEEQLPELIKAPKVELSGLKVLGKIDLPEPKKKEEPVENAETPAPRVEREEFRRRNENRNQQRYPRKNPVALQRQKEIEEERQKREEDRRRQKEMRVLNYEKKMNTLKSIKPAPKVHQYLDEDVEEPEQPALPQPKTFWGKFMRWLNT